jgi:hypothetical protein
MAANGYALDIMIQDFGVTIWVFGPSPLVCPYFCIASLPPGAVNLARSRKSELMTPGCT